MELIFNKEGSNWNKSITTKQIFENQFNPAPFLLNNDHPIIEALNKELFAQYKCIFKFKDRGYNNSNIYINKPLAWRKNKFSKIEFNKGVKLIKGTPTESGGSNNHPRISFKEGFCILEFISDGIPCLSATSGWIIDEIILFEKI